MNNLSVKYFGVLALLLAFLAKGGPADPYSPEEKDGTLVVVVTWGDAYNTPATNVYVEARGFVRKYNSQRSFVLNSSLAGRYETSLPPGVYDVFVSDSISVPACKRVLIKAGSTTSWTLQPELDHVYSEK
ncbi:MAG TPA: hypothetical protein VHA33_12260 [Candidatus Angelobacter sp.]|nr:hypothetical protein [Candidatus Angelobacter sp.]